MPKIGDTIRKNQPKEYALLKAMCSLEESAAKSKEIKVSIREIENLMRHDAYGRGRGGIRQIRRG